MKRCDDCIHDSVCTQTWRMADGCSYYEEPRPHGEWVETDVGDEIYGRYEKCTNCGEEIISTHMSYCGNCGAEMGKGEEQ